MEKLKDSEIYLETIETIHQQLYLDVWTPNVQSFRHQVDVHGEMNPPGKQFIFKINIDVFENQANQLLSRFMVAFIYKIPHFEFFFTMDEHRRLKTETEKELEYLSLESIATMRGLMFGYFKGTPLHHVHLPLVFHKKIDLKSIIE